MNEFKQRPIPDLIVRSVALAAALLVFAVSVLLIADHVKLIKMDPLNDPVLLELRKELGSSTQKNEAVAEKIRTYDLYARRAFFGNQEQRRTGGWLLLGGALVCFAALKLSRLFNPKLPAVEKPHTPGHWELNSLFRQLMAGTGLLLVVVSLFLAFVVQSDLSVVLEKNSVAQPGPGTELKNIDPVGAADFRYLENMKSNWPSFRGAGNHGVAYVQSAPVSWDVKSGAGILWKTELSVPGFNSPVIWGDRLFLSGGTAENLEIFCYDVKSGKELWTAKVESDVKELDLSEDTGYAAPTVTTDGKRVFVIFATGNLAAFDFDGNPVWKKNLGVPDNPYGMGSSLISDGSRLFVQYDQSKDQKVMAFNVATGDLVWEAARTHSSWATPALIETRNGIQLVLNDEKNVTAYDPVSGKQLWQIECLSGEVAPSPAFNGKDILFVANEYAKATALKLTDGTPEILWQFDEYLPDISSPLATPERFYLCTSAGEIVCLDAVTGEVKWEQEFENGFSSSPVLAGGHVYAIDLEGGVHIFDATSDTYHELATVEMGEKVFATPAFVDGRIYIRGKSNLYCIGQ